MGIDACMFVRTTRTYSDTELRQIAGQMCSTIGYDKFFIQRGTQPWHMEGGRHALSLNDDTVASFVEDFGGWEELAQWLDEDVLLLLKTVPESTPILLQDGPPVIATLGEQFISVHLWSRYYGPGYERGDWPTIRMTAEYLEQAFEGGSVWYGGDSSGVLAQPLDAAAREVMTKHYLSVGHAPYRGGFGRYSGSAKQTCDFCGGREMNNVGGGGAHTFYSCDGCGYQLVADDGTEAVEPLTEEESRKDFGGFSAARERLQARQNV